MTGLLRRLGVGRSESLFVRAREDPACFGDLYLAYRDVVMRYFARRVLDPELAFDLAADTFAELYAKRLHFRGACEEEGRAWMWAIARAQLAQWHRQGAVERRNLERVGIPVPSLGPQEYERIEELADLDRLKSVLNDAYSELTPRQRYVLGERVMRERSYEELARELETTTVAVRMTVSRALQQLARLVERRERLADEPRGPGTPTSPSQAKS
jgi:RNA polymerase sigma-70 factor (ECF subfamily)